jgi:type I restriction enzyme S subunit
VLKAAVEGELSREWREAHRHHIEPASDLLIRILTDRRKRDDTRGREPNTETGNPGGWKRSYREPVGPVPSYELDTPAGWRWASFDQVAYSIRSGTPATSRRDDTPYIRYSGRAQSEKGRWISAM